MITDVMYVIIVHSHTRENHHCPVTHVLLVRFISMYYIWILIKICWESTSVRFTQSLIKNRNISNQIFAKWHKLKLWLPVLTHVWQNYGLKFDVQYLQENKCFLVLLLLLLVYFF